MVANKVFQFQCGAIGSRFTSIRCTVYRKVSIPVWCDWEQRPPRTAPIPEPVSIPVWCDWEAAPGAQRQVHEAFQFQCGAIGRSDKSEVSILLDSFNSSVVRLGGNRSLLKLTASTRFNSSVVRLGETLQFMQSMLLMCFNSSVVRLGVRRIRNLSLAISFQFQCGAIGRRAR